MNVQKIIMPKEEKHIYQKSFLQLHEQKKVIEEDIKFASTRLQEMEKRSKHAS